MKTYVIVGNGVAGTTAAENLRKQDAEGRITILTDEDFPFYWRVRLNEYVSGDLEEGELRARKDAWYQERGIDLRLKSAVEGGDAERKIVFTRDKQEFSYDRLLLAMGSHSFIPPIQGADRAGVFALRSLQDARDIRRWAADIQSVVLIGGGLLGLEAGNALLKLGKQVTVVEFFPRLLPRQLDVDGAARLQAILEGLGFSFRLGAKTQAVQGGEKVSGVTLEGGEELPADMVVISAGVRPNLELAEALGLEKDKGIKVDDHLRTSRPDIFAAGDVAEFKGMPYGIWPAAMEQGKIAGTNMAGGDVTYGGTTMANTLKVVGVDLASAGDIDAENKHEAVVQSDDRVYRKAVLDKGRIIGCILLGDTGAFQRITKLMSEKQDVTKIREKLFD